MLTVIIKHDGEDSVVSFTYETLWRELKDIHDAKLKVAENWLDGLDKVKTPFVCFVEADCLVNSGYFSSLLGLLQKNNQERGIAVMGSSVGVQNWANRFYGYELDEENTQGLIPVREKRNNQPYMVEVAYIPGSIIRVSMLKRLLQDHDVKSIDNLQRLSILLSLGFWGQNIGNGIGNKVYLNPTTTYVTTEGYVNDISKFDPRKEIDDFKTLGEMFERHAI